MTAGSQRIQAALKAEAQPRPAAAVPLAARNGAPADRVQRVQAAVERLLQLRDGLVLEGDLRAIAREGLD